MVRIGGSKVTQILGVVLDKELTWSKHVERIKARCQRDLRLMSIVSANGWGADYSTLRTLYVTLIRPKLDYGSFLYETACKSNLIKIDRIHYAALRMMLGALKCTSVEKLEVKANIILLVLRRKQLLLQYVHRAMSIPSHPFRKKLCNYYPFEFDLSNKRALPVTG